MILTCVPMKVQGWVRSPATSENGWISAPLARAEAKTPMANRPPKTCIGIRGFIQRSEIAPLTLPRIDLLRAAIQKLF